MQPRIPPCTARSAFQPALLVATALLVLGAGCGSVTAAGSISDAEHDLDEARGLQAEENAPYEYTRAATYLHKAKEMRGIGQYEQASDYARLSQAAAEKALDVARLSKDRQKRKEKFSPKDKEEGGGPSFTPSGP